MNAVRNRGTVSVDVCLVIKGEHTLTVRWKPCIMEMSGSQKSTKKTCFQHTIRCFWFYQAVFYQIYETKKICEPTGEHLVSVILLKY